MAINPPADGVIWFLKHTQLAGFLSTSTFEFFFLFIYFFFQVWDST